MFKSFFEIRDSKISLRLSMCLLSWTKTVFLFKDANFSRKFLKELPPGLVLTIGLQKIVPQSPIMASGSYLLFKLGCIIASKISKPSIGKSLILWLSIDSRIQNLFISGRKEIEFKNPLKG